MDVNVKPINYRKLFLNTYIVLVLLFSLLFIPHALAGTHADAQTTANNINIAIQSVALPYTRTLTMAQLQSLGYDTYNMTRKGNYTITIKQASYDNIKGTLVLYLNAWVDGKSIAVHNPWSFYMPFETDIGTTNLQRLNTFIKILISNLEILPFGLPINDDAITIYPSVDGYVREDTNAIYSTIRIAAGDVALSTGISYSTGLYTTTVENEFDQLRRLIYSFDTSSIDDTATITSGIFSIYHTGYRDNGLGEPTYGITGGILESNSSLVAGDYDGFLNTRYSNDKTYGTTGRFNYTLNSDGLNTICTTSYCSFVVYVRDSWDIDNSFGGTWASEVGSVYGFYFVEDTDGSRDPFLYIEYTIGAAPVCAFSANDLDACTGQTITFTDASTNTPTDWDWDVDHNINHGKDSDLQNPTWQYSSANTYDVELYCANAYGSDTELQVGYISIDATPTADFTYDISTMCEGDHAHYTDASTGTEETYSWDCQYDTGTDYTTENAQCTYASAGTYSVKHCTDNSGCTEDCEVKNNLVHVDSASISDFTYNTIEICKGEHVHFIDASSGSEDSWKWDCTNDDIDDYTTQDATCTYEMAGTYSVEHCTDSAGCSEDCEVKNNLITVNECTPTPTPTPTPPPGMYTPPSVTSEGDEFPRGILMLGFVMVVGVILAFNERRKR